VRWGTQKGRLASLTIKTYFDKKIKVSPFPVRQIIELQAKQVTSFDPYASIFFIKQETKHKKASPTRTKCFVDFIEIETKQNSAKLKLSSHEKTAQNSQPI
jgi:hypothetical protein